MGWASGSDVMDGFIQRSEGFSEEARVMFYRAIIPALQMADWDTEEECLGKDPVYDQVLREFMSVDDDEEE